MWSVRIVVGLVLGQFPMNRVQGQRSPVERVEFIPAGAIGPFHTAIVFGFFRGQYKQREVQVLASLFEFGHKFTAAIDLDRADRERHLLYQVL